MVNMDIPKKQQQQAICLRPEKSFASVECHILLSLTVDFIAGLVLQIKQPFEKMLKKQNKTFDQFSEMPLNIYFWMSNIHRPLSLSGSERFLTIDSSG